MDILSIFVDYLSMPAADSPVQSEAPDFQLYQQDVSGPENFSIHCEPLYVRSSKHRWEIGHHRHDSYFQLFVITDGAGEIFFDGEYHQFEAPAALFIPAGVVHGFRFFAGSDGRVVTALTELLQQTCGPDPSFSGFFCAVRIVSLRATDGATLELSAQIDQLEAELVSDKSGSNTCASALLLIALVSLTRAQYPKLLPANEMASDRDMQRLQALDVMIARNYRQRESVLSYAEQFGISAHQLNRIALKHTGKTVHQMVDARVIAEAKRLLATTPASVREVAEHVGFSDHSYFNRFFTKHAGRPPGRWRSNQGRGSATEYSSGD